MDIAIGMSIRLPFPNSSGREEEREMESGKIRKFVRDRYAGIASRGGSCCGPGGDCGSRGTASVLSKGIGYSEEEARSVPEGADLGLGCGNPTALATLTEGETVLDLGSGAGFDCFLAARKVGEKGRVIGVDMTPEMIEKARENAKKGGFGNVEFRLGEIESLPVADASVDVILSNCVINLSTEKERVFNEAYRVLRPGGRVMISDLVLTRELPEPVRSSLEAYAGCISGAIPLPEYLGRMESAGFRDIRIEKERAFDIVSDEMEAYGKWFADTFRIPLEAIRDAAGSIASVSLSGIKPE